MIDEHGVSEGERRFILACLMIETMRERYRLSDGEMDYVLSIALQVEQHALAGTKDAMQIVMEATGRLSGVVAQMARAIDKKRGLYT